MYANAKLLIVDSNNRDIQTQSSSNFRYTLDGPGLYGITSYRINKICIPYSFYSIPEQQIRLDDNGVSRDITIPAGTYVASEIQGIFQTAITAAGGTGANYTISYSVSNYRFTITRTAGTFSMDFLTAAGFSGSFGNYKNIGILMGLISPGTTATASGISFTGPFAANLSGITKIKVVCPELCQDYSTVDIKDSSAVIASVNITADRGEFITWEAETDLWFRVNSKLHNGFRFSLIDNEGNPVDLNGKNWTIEIYLSSAE